MKEIRPQAGKQEEFLSTSADIAIYGGAAGGGKSFAILLEAIRHVGNANYGAVIFRRNTTHIKAEGGLWDTSASLYPFLGARPKDQKIWTFPSGAKVTLTHLEYERTVYDWQGSQVPFIGFDELTHFTRKQFFYMLTRNRSTCGVKPYIRATTNPDADSWVAEFISFWIDQETGYAIEERSGVIRYLIIQNDEFVWGDTPQELMDKYGVKDFEIKSVTFIPSSLQDNKILMETDPTYIANLKAQDKVERERLLSGNWKIKPSAGLYFKKEYFNVIEALPPIKEVCRYWDLAATEKTATNDPDFTVGVKMARLKDGAFCVIDVIKMQSSPNKVEQAILNTASQDGRDCIVGISQDPGQAGKSQAQQFTAKLAGYKVKTPRETGDKVTRASAYSAQCEAGNVSLLLGNWNTSYLNELENFPPETTGHDDQVDASSGAFNLLAQPISTPRIRAL